MDLDAIFDEAHGNSAPPSPTPAPVGVTDLGTIGLSQGSGSSMDLDSIFDAAHSEGESSSTPGFLESVGQGILDTPKGIVTAIGSIPSGISNIAQTVAHPIDSVRNGTAEKTARGVGSLAAGLAGAGAGSILGPIGTIAGGAAGLLGFDWLNQLTGSDAPTTPEEDISKLGYNLGQGGGTYAIGGALSGAGRGVRGVFRAGKSLTPKGAAARALEKAGGDEIRALSDNPSDPFYPTRTLAEEVQSPKLASLQDQVAKRYEPANAALVANEAERRAIQQSMLEDLSQQPARSAEAAGEQVRNLIQRESDATFKAAIDKGVPLANQQRTVPVAGLADQFRDLLDGEYKAGGAPRDLVDISKEIRAATAKAAAEVTPGDSLVPAKPFDYVHDLRERVGQAWLDLKGAGDAKGARVADLMRTAIDDAIEKAPESGGSLRASDVARFQASKEAYSEAADIYKSGQLGHSLNRLKEGQYQDPSSGVIGQYFNGRPEGTRQLLRALPKTQAALDNARGAIRDLVRRTATDNDGNLSAGKFRTWVRENREALTAEEGGRRLFEPEHVAALEQIADDLGLVSSTSSRSVKNLAFRASKGQPTTAQALMIDFAGRVVGKDIPGARSAVQAWQSARDAILTRALISDKAFAQELVKPATPARLLAIKDALAYAPAVITAAQGTQDRQRTQSPPSPQTTRLLGTRTESQSQAQRPKLKTESSPYAEPRSVPSGTQGKTGGLFRPVAATSEDLGTSVGVFDRAFDNIKGNGGQGAQMKNVALVEREIDQDPYLSALYETESGRNPTAKNKNSTASGGFQFVKATAKGIGLLNPMDLEESLVAVRKLTDQNAKQVGKDPGDLYAAHFLGAPLAKKWLNGDKLTAKEAQHVKELETVALPRFMRIYKKVLQRRTGQVDV